MARKPQITIPVNHQNLAMIGAILVAAASIIWGASKIDSRVADIEKWIVANADTQVKLVEAKSRSEVLEENQHIIMRHLDDLDKTITGRK